MASRIIYEPETCWQCGACVATCPDFFEQDASGKTRLRNAKRQKKNEMGTKGVTINDVVDVADAGCAETAAENCPARAIHLKKL